MKILNFGSCNIDFVYSLDHIVKPGETETTYKMETFPGGKGLNQSIALARAGAMVYHAGCIGEDGDMLKKILSESNVDISYLKTIKEKNGHAIIQVTSNGENSIFLYPGTNDMVEKEYIDCVLKNFDAGDILLLQNEISNVNYIIEEAHKMGMCIILNPSPINEQISKIDLNMLSYIILNEVEAKSISGCCSWKECIKQIRNSYPGLKVMLTLGNKGCVYSDGDIEISQQAYKVKAVDTTAAGDTFTGYFVAGLSSEKDIKEILETASVAAGISVTRNGAAPSIPSKNEVMSVVARLRSEV